METARKQTKPGYKRNEFLEEQLADLYERWTVLETAYLVGPDIAEFDSRLNVLETACLMDHDVQELDQRTRLSEKVCFEDHDMAELDHDVGELDERMRLLERVCRVIHAGRMGYLHELIGEAMDRIDWMAHEIANLAMVEHAHRWSGSSTPASSSTVSEHALPCIN